jgi:hypothetical protein
LFSRISGPTSSVSHPTPTSCGVRIDQLERLNKKRSSHSSADRREGSMSPFSRSSTVAVSLGPRCPHGLPVTHASCARQGSANAERVRL